jgi:uncharacterized protein
MQTLDEVKSQLEAVKPVLRTRFQVDTIGIFGSYCRSEQKEKSDIDILITLVEPNSFDLVDLVGLRRYLSRKLNKKVDVVLKRALKEAIRDGVLEETVYV